MAMCTLLHNEAEMRLLNDVAMFDAWRYTNQIQMLYIVMHATVWVHVLKPVYARSMQVQVTGHEEVLIRHEWRRKLH